MKSTAETIEALKIQESNFYKNSYLYPFIYTYLTNPNICKIKIPFKLLHNYSFDKDYNSNYDYKHTYVFVGYRWLSRKFWPLFIAVSKYEEDKVQTYHVNGFSTYEPNFSWFKTYKDLGFIKNLPVIIRTDECYQSDKTPPLYKQIESMGKKVIVHFEVKNKKKF